jgi:hypothetical protein
MKLPADSPATAISVPKPDIGWAGACALAFVLLCSLPSVAGGAYVFYASIRPVTISTGYFADFADVPWIGAALLILVAWLLGPVPLLIAGLIHLLGPARRNWRAAVAWGIAVAAGSAIGYLISNDYALLFSAYPQDIDGSPLGPSRWAPSTPYWQALFAVGGQLAVGTVMIALITASARKGNTAAKQVATA